MPPPSIDSGFVQISVGTGHKLISIQRDPRRPWRAWNACGPHEEPYACLRLSNLVVSICHMNSNPRSMIVLWAQAAYSEAYVRACRPLI
jgi:hypothetical protein